MQTDKTLLAQPEDVASAPTMVAPSRSGASSSTTPSRVRTAARTTVLPRRDAQGAPPADHPDAELRYAPLKRLGEGGMGEVALVRDQDIGRDVAVKRLLPGLSADALDRFAREVRIVGRLEHPNIVPIHDVGVDADGQHYFVMKYVEGETLETIIQKLREGDAGYAARYSIGRRTEIFLELLQALRYAHAHGVIHRDIKPANVMVGAYGEVMLMDWGIAKELGEKEPASAPASGPPSDAADRFRTHQGALVGTPAYMSPEQAKGAIDALDARCDTYSLTVLFHEMLMLRHYLEAKKTTTELLVAIVSDPSPTFFDLIGPAAREGVPAELLHFLSKGLSKEPQHRYASIEEMIEVLDSIRDDRVKVQCHITMTKRVVGALSRRTARHPLLATALGVFSLAVFLAGLVAVAAQVHRWIVG